MCRAMLSIIPYAKLSRLALASSLAISFVTIGSANFADAQQYKSIPPQIQIRASRALRGKVNQAMRNGPFSAEGKQSIDGYYKKFYFPRMTQYDSQSLMLLGRLREDLMKSLRGAKVPKAQEYLSQVAMGICGKLARDNYHPAVRYNATLILGQLDKQFPVSGANPVRPIASTASTEQLLDLLEQAEFNGVKVHPSVRVGALEGLERHLRFGMDAQFSDRVTAASLSVLAQDAKAIEIDPDVNNWMKCQAAKVLVRQFKEGPTKAVHDALTALIADESMNLEDRCRVSGLLEAMTYTAGAEADATATLLPLGNLTKDVVAEGADVARDFQSIILGEKPGVRRPRNLGRGDGPSGPKLERRQLLSRLVQIEQGASSLSNGMPDAEKQKLAELTSLIEPVIKQSTNSKNYDDIDLIRAVIKLENSVDTLIASWQPAAAPVGDDVDFGE
ncbi:MAG: hypothetical protein AAGD11_13045 [Planctomycetota bacterium]